MDYKQRQSLIAIRQLLAKQTGSQTRGISGNPAAADNAAVSRGRGQITEIYDVLDATGAVTFQLGVTGLIDTVEVE